MINLRGVSKGRKVTDDTWLLFMITPNQGYQWENSFLRGTFSCVIRRETKRMVLYYKWWMEVRIYILWPSIQNIHRKEKIRTHWSDRCEGGYREGYEYLEVKQERVNIGSVKLGVRPYGNWLKQNMEEGGKGKWIWGEPMYAVKLHSIIIITTD